MTLAALQRAFQGHVVDGHPAAPPAGPLGERGYRVYRHAYRATLGDALRDTFARTAAWLGDKAFAAAVEAYVGAVHPSSWTLGGYGERFTDALADIHPDDPDVAELAWLEWQLRHAFAAADAPPADPKALAAADWERIGLCLHPAVAARVVTADVAGIWHAVGEARAPDRVLLPVTDGLIVWRDGFQPRFRMTAAVEAEALAALRKGGSFADAARLAGSPGAAGAWLARWLRDGLVAGIA